MGAGAWGTTFALLCHRTGQRNGQRTGEEVSLWARRAELAERMRSTGRNDDYLPGIDLPAGMRITADAEEALEDADLVVVAVPSLGLAQQLARWGHAVPPDATLASLVKGLDPTSGRFASRVISDALGCDPDRVVAVSGPNLALECALGRPSATVVACPDRARAERVQRAIMSPVLRAYTNPDRVGVEVAGVVKNVIAIAAGVAQGLGHGANTTAFLVTRGLAEMMRLGVALGADPLTFSGLAGVGDLMATCASPDSRNRTVGERLGRGEALADIEASMRTVAEGVRAAPVLARIAAEQGVDMPMVAAVVAVCHAGADIAATGEALLARPPRSEW
jgi:glycerol-3-phosphate dehydrogenase (NAD(P)+)